MTKLPDKKRTTNVTYFVHHIGFIHLNSIWNMDPDTLSQNWKNGKSTRHLGYDKSRDFKRFFFQPMHRPIGEVTL